MDQKVFTERFTVLRSLGQGGMSEVFLARDSMLSGEVALKVIHPHHAKNPLVIDRFRREVGISRRIRHPGVIRIYDLYEVPEENLLFLSMEYLPGGNLKGRIQTLGALPVREVVALGLESLSALEAAHEAGIVHRDIKPHNLLFGSDGHVRITDFGLSRTCLGSDALSDTASAGTPEYCAPEIALGEYADSRSDLYSLGVTLFEALTGKLPFTGSNPYVVLKQQADSPVPRLRDFRDDIPGELEAVIGKALEKDPADRFQTAREFREALSELRVKTAPAARYEYVCPRCGEPLGSTLPHCFRCGETVLDLVPAGKGRERYKVFVLGTGKPGDKLSADDRSRILSLLKRDELSTTQLEKQIPRVPFVLLPDLDRTGAETLAKKLTDMGIPSRAEGRGNPEDNRAVRKAMTKKVMALAPRIWLIVLGTSGGLYGNIGRIGAHDLGLVLLVLFAVLFAGIPGLVALTAGYPNVKFREGGTKSANPFRKRFLETAGRLTSPILRSLLKAVAGKLDAAFRLTETSGVLSDRDRRELTAELERSTDRWCSLLERIQSFESVLKSANDTEYEREAGALEAEFFRSDSTAASGVFAEDRQKTLGMIRDRRELERLRDRNLDTLLKFTSLLDRVALSLGKSEAGRAAGELKEAAEGLEDALDARAVLEESAAQPGEAQ